LLVVLDVDSTLIQQEVIELLAEHAGALEEISQITNAAMAGEIDFSQSLLKRVALLEGLDVSCFDRVLAEITITDGVAELIEAVHRVEGKIAAVSGGFSQILEPLANSIGLDFWMANELEIAEEKLTGKITGEIIDANAKADALRSWAKQSGLSVEECVAVGDGANDIKMLEAAGFAVAFSAKPILRQYADYVIEENSLRPLIEKLGLSAS
jgi:phosphoserine phosphatase